MSRKSVFFSFGRDFGFLVLGEGIIELFPRGKAKVLEGPGYIVFTVSKSKAEVPEGLGYLLFIVSKGKGLGSSIIVN